MALLISFHTLIYCTFLRYSCLTTINNQTKKVVLQFGDISNIKSGISCSFCSCNLGHDTWSATRLPMFDAHLTPRVTTPYLRFHFSGLLSRLGGLGIPRPLKREKLRSFGARSHGTCSKCLAMLWVQLQSMEADGAWSCAWVENLDTKKGVGPAPRNFPVNKPQTKINICI